MDEIGDMLRQSEEPNAALQQRIQDEEMRKLSGEPYHEMVIDGTRIEWVYRDGTESTCS